MENINITEVRHSEMEFLKTSYVDKINVTSHLTSIVKTHPKKVFTNRKCIYAPGYNSASFEDKPRNYLQAV